MIVHLLFNTYRFGVNNQWWCTFDSMFGKPWKDRVKPKQWLQSYRGMKFRAIGCYFVAKPWKLFPRYYKNKVRNQAKED